MTHTYLDHAAIHSVGTGEGGAARLRAKIAEEEAARQSYVGESAVATLDRLIATRNIEALEGMLENSLQNDAARATGKYSV